MALIPRFSRSVTQQSIASYDAMDAALSVGYKRYYGAKGESTYFLTSQVVDSTYNATYTDGTAISPVTADCNTLTFDMTFKTPQYVQGNAITQITAGLTQIGGSGGYTWYTVSYIYHVTAGGTETLLSSEAGQTFTNATVTNRFTMENYISGQRYAINEKMRLKVAIYINSAAANFNPVRIYHDPSNRAQVNSQDTDLIIDIPFKIQQ